MGSSQEYSPTNSNRKPDLFDQAEQAAFRHVVANLNEMPYCDRADLEQAAASYFWQSIHNSGTAHLFRAAYIERKAATWAAWWNQKHLASRTRRPHTKYTPAQAARGRRVALIRKRGATDWTALRAQLARERGDKLAAIAGELGCSLRTASRLSKRLFPRIVGAVLSCYYGWTHGKSSTVGTSEIKAMGNSKELYRVADSTRGGRHRGRPATGSTAKAAKASESGGYTGHPAGTVGRATALSGKNSAGHPAGHR